MCVLSETHLKKGASPGLAFVLYIVLYLHGLRHFDVVVLHNYAQYYSVTHWDILSNNKTRQFNSTYLYLGIRLRRDNTLFVKAYVWILTWRSNVIYAFAMYCTVLFLFKRVVRNHFQAMQCTCIYLVAVLLEILLFTYTKRNWSTVRRLSLHRVICLV